MSRALATLVVMAVAAAGCDGSEPPPAGLDAHVHDAAPDASDVRDVARPDAPSRCVDGVALPYPDAPPAIDLGVTLPDLTFATAAGAVSLREHYAPCAARPRVLVLRTMTAWSGPSQQAAAHTARVLDHPLADRVTLVDLLALGPDDTPATAADLPAWAARYDRPPHALALDPGYRLRTLYLSAGELPLYAFVDTRTMVVAHVLPNPTREEVAWQVTAMVAELDGLPRPRMDPPALHDGRFTDDQMELMRAMVPVVAPPPDPTNRYEDHPLAASLGARIFRDTMLSSNGMVSCSTCHDAATAFVDGRPQAVGVARGDRNTPSVVAAAYTRWRFWDGRVDTLWAQALGPIENPLEMNSSRLAAVRRVVTAYADDYIAVFGAVPDLSRLPASGRPGDPAWEALPAADRALVDRHFANLGKAVAAFERTRRPPMSPLDRYVMGEVDALTAAQRNGLQHFFIAGCAQCHHGPMLTDDSFHNIGMPTGRRDGMPDRGRIDAIAGLLALPFRSDGPFSDDPTPGAHLGRLVSHPSQLGAFHTPSLRGVGRTGPWGHGGTFANLRDVVRHYAQGLTMPPVAGTVGDRDIHLPAFHMDDVTINELTALLEVL
ncbi:MAG: cytochrome c peroxidase [Polyangiales bacterium]